MTTTRSTRATNANTTAIAGKAAGASAAHSAAAPVAQTTSPNVASTIRNVSALRARAAPPMPATGSWYPSPPLRSTICALPHRTDFEAAIVFDNQHTFALAEWAHDRTGKAEHGGLVGRAVSDHERPAAIGQCVEH